MISVVSKLDTIPGYLPVLEYNNFQETTIEQCLAEAIRFYNFHNRKIIKKNWTKITNENLEVAILGLRNGFHLGLREIIKELTELKVHGGKKIKYTEFSNYYNEKKNFFDKPKNQKRNSTFYVDKANRGRHVVRLFLSDKYRTKLFVESSPKKLNFHCKNCKLVMMSSKFVVLNR